MNADQHLEIRAPIEALEAALTRRDLEHPRTVADDVRGQLRYVLSFAKMTTVRNEAGEDIEVAERLAPHRWRVLEALKPHLEDDGHGLHGAARALEGLLEGTRRQRDRLLEEASLDRESLEAEVTTRQLVVVSGGGGGSGYGYAGGYTLLHRYGLQPELVAGTSMGALLGVFRV